MYQKTYLIGDLFKTLMLENPLAQKDLYDYDRLVEVISRSFRVR